ncbi:MAG TPA: HslU--HslV peptidase proteolytic subunit [Clostridiales bacterium]|nr:HslU--HslV peptidase proteolytic subunit [Clostridiales bacterium]
MEQFRGTTIVAVKRDGKTAIAGDGQVTMGQNVVMKNNAVKVRRIYDDKVVIGFAGGVADAFSLCNRFEDMLNKFSGNLMRSAVELALQFRNDEIMRKLEALMIVADKDNLFMISGNGEVIEPDGGVCAIGSGGNYALSAGIALMENTKLSAREIAEKALNIAGNICIFTNHHITVEEV